MCVEVWDIWMGDTAAGSGQEYKNWKDLEELDTTDQKVYMYIQ